MFELSRNEKKLRAAETAKFRLKQYFEKIDWEFDYLKPKLAAFKAQAKLPELPAENIIDVQWEAHDPSDDPSSPTS